jgi:ABC-type uncharacterized transport system auxiliary subunit
MAILVLTMGCALRTSQVVSYYGLDYPPPSRASDAPIGDTLMVYQFLLDPSVDPSYLVVSRPQGTEKSAMLHRWKDNPADMIAELTVRDLERSGLFQHAVDQFSNLPYRFALEGTIRKLQGVMKDGKIFATVEVEAVLVDFEARGGGEKRVLAKAYQTAVPSESSSPDAIVAALNKAMAEISAQLRNDIRSALTRKTGS